MLTYSQKSNVIVPFKIYRFAEIKQNSEEYFYNVRINSEAGV